MNPLKTVKAEFHCHTIYSKDSLVVIEKLTLACHKKAIQRLVITDHNSIAGAKYAYQLNPELFIVGEEIMTLYGELLGFFLQEAIPGGLSAIDTIDRLRSQGAFISVSHPFDTLRAGHWRPEDLESILPYIDAIEVFNSRCMDGKANTQASEFAIQHNLLATVGSDSHTLGEIGRSTLTLPDFVDAMSLKAALKTAQRNIRLSSPWVHFYSSYARWYKKRRAASKKAIPAS
jgi:predicted metal-dependent phosphoesterase TrpH